MLWAMCGLGVAVLFVNWGGQSFPMSVDGLGLLGRKRGSVRKFGCMGTVVILLCTAGAGCVDVRR